MAERELRIHKRRWNGGLQGRYVNRFVYQPGSLLQESSPPLSSSPGLSVMATRALAMWRADGWDVLEEAVV
jgi:hypothetical protein